MSTIDHDLITKLGHLETACRALADALPYTVLDLFWRWHLEGERGDAPGAANTLNDQIRPLLVAMDAIARLNGEAYPARAEGEAAARLRARREIDGFRVRMGAMDQ